MSPRPRKVSDDDVLLAAQRVMARLGPNELTLAAIAHEAGLTAGALVQRFGSKRGLLLTLSERFSGGIDQMFADLRKQHRSPLAALYAYSDCMANLATSPAALARNFAYLQIDLTDPDFRHHLARQAKDTRRGLEELVRDAVSAKELSPVSDPRQLARTVEAVISGSMMSWAFYQQGSALEWMREDLKAVLKPYIKQRAKKER